MADMKPHIPCHVCILVLPESSMMCLASVLEPLRAANRVAGEKLFQWEVTSLTGAPVWLTCNVYFPVDGQFTAQCKGDLLVVIGGFNQQRHVTSVTLSTIRKVARAFDQTAGIEAGSWILARAGLLDGHAATTHWEDFEAFANAYPETDVRLDRYVIDGRRLTCGGASPAFDMFLDLIGRKYGQTIAMEAASVFIYDEAHSGSDAQPLVSLGRAARKERRLEQSVRLMEQWIEQPMPVAAIARRVGISSATLEALFKKHTGMTPGKFYLNLRLKVASRLVLDTDLSLREIAIRSGFNSLSAFSRAYARTFGRTARESRNRA